MMSNILNVLKQGETMQTKATIKRHSTSTFQIAVATIFAALVTVATMISVIPIPAMAGYFNLGDTLIYTAALLFGPFVGLVAGIGAVIADIAIAPAYAPATLIIKTIEGFLVGYLMKKLNKKIKNLTLCAAIAILIGGFEMIAGYFVYETFINGYPVALAEVPLNIIQMLASLIIAIPVMHTVARIFPQFRDYL